MLFSALLLGVQVLEPAPILNSTRPTPLFEKPSAQSKVLADVDPGVPFIARGVSPKETWIWVEDEEGNRGWIPSNRSNYSQFKTQSTLPNPLPNPLPNSLAPSSGPVENSDDSEIESRFEQEGDTEPEFRKDSTEHRLALSQVFFWNRPLDYQEQGSGLLYSWLPAYAGRVRDRSGLSLGLRYFKESDAWDFPLRFESLRTSSQGDFSRGFDFGFVYRRTAQENDWNLSLGYKLGFEKAPFFGLLRGGLEFIRKRQWSLEWSIGYKF